MNDSVAPSEKVALSRCDSNFITAALDVMACENEGPLI